MGKNELYEALSKKTDNGAEVVKGLSEVFGVSVNPRMATIPISQLREKENHPFKVTYDDAFYDLVVSIVTFGLIQPIIVRQIDMGVYEILSGHRRTKACWYNGDKEIRAIVVQADDELANRIMITTNFHQRIMQLPSEIAHSYLIRYTDIKKRKHCLDENSTGWNSDEKIAEILEKEFSTSKSKVYLYLRLNHLIEPLMEALDNKKLNIKIAAELSYLSESEQADMYELVCEKEAYALDLKKAKEIKKNIGKLSRNKIIEILEKEDEVDIISFSKREVKKYKSKFSDMNSMRNAIVKFLEEYS
ncbi:MAG: ParB/RepB/Spo0J family partition protein [Clostridia bacterium]|nr:ParB/RepB/Spo0J family partition protein [Clostridia bacterium]